MKAKLYVFMVFGLIYNTVAYSGPIQQRLEAALEGSQYANEIVFVAFLLILPEKMSEKMGTWFGSKLLSVQYRSELLYQLLECIKKKMEYCRKNHILPNEQDIANQCFNDLASTRTQAHRLEQQAQQQYPRDNLALKMEKQELKIEQQELERIRKRDLRQSWFWWLW